MFCAIPYSTSCYKVEDPSSQSAYEMINMVPMTSETITDITTPTVDPVDETTKQPLTTSLHHLEPKTISTGHSKQTILTHSNKLSSQTYLGETEAVKENEKETMKETTEENAPACSQLN